jgi:hypothetical protein
LKEKKTALAFEQRYWREPRNDLCDLRQSMGKETCQSTDCGSIVFIIGLKEVPNVPPRRQMSPGLARRQRGARDDSSWSCSDFSPSLAHVLTAHHPS